MVILIVISDVLIGLLPAFIHHKSCQKFVNFISPLRKPVFGFIETYSVKLLSISLNLTLLFSSLSWGLLLSNQAECLAYSISASLLFFYTTTCKKSATFHLRKLYLISVFI